MHVGNLDRAETRALPIENRKYLTSYTERKTINCLAVRTHPDVVGLTQIFLLNQSLRRRTLPTMIFCNCSTLIAVCRSNSGFTRVTRPPWSS